MNLIQTRKWSFTLEETPDLELDLVSIPCILLINTLLPQITTVNQPI